MVIYRLKQRGGAGTYVGLLRANGEVQRLKVQIKVSGPEMRKILHQLYEALDDAAARKKEAHRMAVKYGQRYEEIRRFQAVPGVGPVIACVFSAIVQTPHRFKNKRRLWHYSGLAVTDRSSNGKPLSRRHLDRMANNALEDLSRRVFQAAVVSSKQENLFKRFFRESLKRCDSATHARLNTQRKILATLYGMWKGGTEFREAG